MFDQAEHRDPGHRRRWVVLVDGDRRRSIDLIKTEALQRGVDVHIIVDPIHVLEYLWRAAWCLHDNGDASAETRVARHARPLLAGGVRQTAAAIEEAARTAGLRGAQRKGIDEAVNHLTGKAEHLHCDTALIGSAPFLLYVRDVQTLLTSVYRSSAPLPISRPQPLALKPPQGAAASTGLGMLMNTVPARMLPGDAVGGGHVAGPDGGGQAVVGVVGASDGLVLVVVGQDAETGPKISSRAMRMSSPTPVNTVGS